MRWLRALWLVGFVLGGGCFQVDLICTCVLEPTGLQVWRCGGHDMAVSAIPVRDLSGAVDDGGLVDGSVSD
jgi:hypothetical protein